MVHIITDYVNKGGSPRLIKLKCAPWHHACHDKYCQHDFCVEQRARWHIDMFGARVAAVVKALGDVVKTANVPKFLSEPHRELEGRSPLHIIWEFDDDGFRKVMQIIEGVASGVYV